MVRSSLDSILWEIYLRRVRIMMRPFPLASRGMEYDGLLQLRV